MESENRRVRIQNYKTQLAECNDANAALLKKLESALTEDQRIDLGKRLDETVKKGHALQFLINMMERQEKKETIDAA